MTHSIALSSGLGAWRANATQRNASQRPIPPGAPSEPPTARPRCRTEGDGGTGTEFAWHYFCFLHHQRPLCPASHPAAATLPSTHFEPAPVAAALSVSSHFQRNLDNTYHMKESTARHAFIACSAAPGMIQQTTS